MISLWERRENMSPEITFSWCNHWSIHFFSFETRRPKFGGGIFLKPEILKPTQIEHLSPTSQPTPTTNDDDDDDADDWFLFPKKCWWLDAGWRWICVPSFRDRCCWRCSLWWKWSQINFFNLKPVPVAWGCKFVCWTVTLMDVKASGAALGQLGSWSSWLWHPSRGQWLPSRGSDAVLTFKVPF